MNGQCEARQYSDRVRCDACQLSWDVNDPVPPMCHPIAPPRYGDVPAGIKSLRSGELRKYIEINPLPRIGADFKNALETKAMTTRFCKDCEHFRRVSVPVFPYLHLVCVHPTHRVTDPVQGVLIRRIYCEDQRNPNLHSECGEEGRLFERKLGLFTRLRLWLTGRVTR